MYKINVPIIVTYQAANIQTGKTIKMDVYDETHALDAGKSVAAMTEIGTTGRYYATFTPDTEGEWIVIMENTGAGVKMPVVTSFTIGNQNLNSLGIIVDAIKTKTDNLPTDPADQSDMELIISSSESNIRGTDNDDLKTISDQLDLVGSPPMVG